MNFNRQMWPKIRPREPKTRKPRVPTDIRDLITERCGGRCERCAQVPDGGDIHHRIPCGEGGSRDPRLSRASNLVALCRRCHSDIELHRFVAMDHGWLVLRVRDPRAVPVMSGLHGRVLLDDGGGVTPARGDITA
jgi:hypothetical protein